MERVIAYVDAFNLYFGLKDSGFRRYLWLNVQRLARNLLKPGQELVMTKYFTARVSQPPDKAKRQGTFLEALGTLTDFQIYYGKYQLNPFRCRKCKSEVLIPDEKMTDVQIAVHLLTDAYQDLYDTVLLISADSDLVPSVEMVERLFPSKRVVLALPPKRFSRQLQSVVSSYFYIGRDSLEKSLFPPEIKKPDGFVLKCPEKWANPASQRT